MLRETIVRNHNHTTDFEPKGTWLTCTFASDLGAKQRRQTAEVEKQIAETEARITYSTDWSIEPCHPVANIIERHLSPAPDSHVLPVASWLEATRPIEDEEQFRARHLLVLRSAIEIHIRHLEIDKVQFINPRSISPYVKYGFEFEGGYREDPEERITYLREYMPHLAPEGLQRTVQHHPYIDLIPFQGFRQTILEILRDSPHSINQFELCYDIEMGGLRLWGQRSYDPWSYELTEGFAAKWGYLFQRDTEALSATNVFRKERGEQPLGFQHFGAAGIHLRSRERFDLQLIHMLGNRP